MTSSERANSVSGTFDLADRPRCETTRRNTVTGWSMRQECARGDTTACASDADLVDSLSVEAFHSAERARVGKILQEMVTEAEDMGLYDIEPLTFRR